MALFRRKRTNEQTSKRFIHLSVCSFVLWFVSSALWADSDRVCIVITGLGGMPEYEENFVQWAGAVEKLFREELKSTVHNLDGRTQKRTEVIEFFNNLLSSLPAQAEIWLFLIGHGNFDGTNYRFNIVGPDLTGSDLGTFLNGLGEKRTCVVAATGASGILIPQLSKRNRLIIAATKNQFERQPPLFLSFFIEAAKSAEADLDRNGKISVLEAFVFSQKKVGVWFEEKGRLQTEHPLLDDNGDGRGAAEPNPSEGEGSLASMTYLTAPPEQAYRSLEAQQLSGRRVKIEREIEDLKFRKKELSESEYYQQLEKLLIELAKLNAQIAELEGKK